MTYQTKQYRFLPCLTAVALATSLLCATAAAETIYKSVDAQGNVTFSNTPPPADVESQQIELQPGPTPAEQQQSLDAEQNLESQGNAITEENATPEQEAPEVQPVMEYQQESVDGDNENSGDNQDPVVVDEGTVGERTRDERVRDGVDDVREVSPVPAEIHRPAGRVR